MKDKFPDEKIYYDDISGYDGINIGHKSHRKGENIDIRYPGTNANIRFYYQSSYYKSKEKDDSELVKILEAILDIARQWKFTKNYVYINGIRNSIYASNHEHHYHIGCRNYN